MIHLDGEQAEIAQAGLQAVSELLSKLVGALRASAGLRDELPSAVARFALAVTALGNALAKANAPADVDEEHLPLLRTAIQLQRKRIAEELESHRANASHPELISLIERRLAPFQVLLQQPWFAAVEPLRIPKPSDFLTLRKASEFVSIGTDTHGPMEDKFGILLAASAILGDLRTARLACEARDLPVAFAFLDIDEFKTLNSKYGEPRVDRDILPPFMRELERAVFGHGRAYRYGGDEFALLLPNCPQGLAVKILRDVAASLAQLDYPGIPERPSVSTGLCILPPESWLTDHEVVEYASSAKKHAKAAGHQCIALYAGSLFREEDLRVE